MKNTIKLTLSLFLVVSSSMSFAQQWETQGNFLNSPDNKLGTRNATDVNFITDDITRLTLTSDGFVGVGTSDPNAWQEITYCPPVNTPQSGLIVTMNKCNGNVLQVSETVGENIGGGMMPSAGGGETGGTSSVDFEVPFNFLTGNNTNLVNPLYNIIERPIFGELDQSNSK